MTDEEFQDKAMQEYADERERQLLKDAEVFSRVASIVSDEVMQEIKMSMKESDNTYDFSIVEEPIGYFQEEGYFKNLKGQWVDQTTNGGYTGDEFAGTVCIQISENEYFKFHYYM